MTLDQSALFDADTRRPWQRSATLGDVTRNERGASHTDAGDTEVAAAALVAPRVGSLRARALALIVESGDLGYTAYELHVDMGELLYSVAPRMAELQRAGWIIDSGRRRPTPTGGDAIVWVGTEAGRREWA